ncbi:hypothetical protein [Alicyclobacillus fodiniaquatilis]|uniref:Uncharacterized protein n=1 Tax=Alicyclobacillus fodiniaquatilis TaxID=1661150 RepID=A0ABW4JK12_9BACL
MSVNQGIADDASPGYRLYFQDRQKKNPPHMETDIITCDAIYVAVSVTVFVIAQSTSCLVASFCKMNVDALCGMAVY